MMSKNAEGIDNSVMVKCKDCGRFIGFYYCGEWCEDCFDKGLHKDMNEHFDNFIETELKEALQKDDYAKA